MTTTLHRSLAHLRLRAHRRARAAVLDGDSGAALLLALMTIMIATVLSLAVLATVVTQVAPAQFAQKNVRTIHAAEAGIDVALGRLRNASTIDVANPGVLVGDRRQLPCDSGTKAGTLTGSIAGAPGGLGYVTAVQYFSEDPSGRSASWRTTNSLACTSSGGPVLTPNYALITSEGVGADLARGGGTAAERELETIYDFQLSNKNISGGLIARYNDGAAATLNLCFDAGSDAPPEGTLLRVQLCDPGRPSQLWSWRPDSTIALSATQNGSTTLCVAGLGATTTVTDVPLTLQLCNGADFQQKWGFTDNAAFAARLRNVNNTSNTPEHCIYLTTSNTVNTVVRASTGGCGLGDLQRQWRPDARVGAGKAGSLGEGNPSGQQFQWVNFFEFGRCFDVTNWDVNKTFMIAYPCKQDVSGYVGWNQTLEWNETTGHLFTYSGATGNTFLQNRNATPTAGPQQCLTAPSTNGGRVLLERCSLLQARHSWEVYRKRGSYATSYTIEDSNGRCLSIGPPDTGSGASLAQWSTIISETCNGSARQKWNAPPDAAPTTLRDTQELNG